MRRAKGQSDAFSLFPFLAVLLCTMGALVVLLVATAHVARGRAARQAEADRVAAELEAAKADPEKLRLAKRRRSQAAVAAERLESVADALRERLADEQHRLSVVEGDLRKLTDEIEALRTEAAELFRIEAEHYDDEKIARQELERLNELIGELEVEVEELKHAAAGRERRFAVVPLRDRTRGTVRPPVYFECDKSGVTLQPEGVAFSYEDLAAPKFSSPVAAAMRAVDRYYTENPEARAAGEAGQPYPLIVVRPGGVPAFYGARSAFEQAGADFGYQPIGADWPLEYGEANPVLAADVAEAVETARREREGLRRIMPQLAEAMARTPASGPRSGGISRGRRAGASGVAVQRRDGSENPFAGLRFTGPATRAGGSPPPRDSKERIAADQNTAVAAASGGTGAGQGGPDTPRSVAKVDPGSPPPAGAAVPTLPAQAVAAANAPTPDPLAGEPPPSVTAGGPGGNQTQGDAVAAANTVSKATAGGPPQRRSAGGSRGRKRSEPRNGLPMVRPIRVVVSRDQLTVLPDRAQAPDGSRAGASLPQTVALAGPTGGSINRVVDALKRHADGWGIAGAGFYWEPRIVLNVTADGDRRAADLTRLLEQAGLKVQAAPVATRPATPTRR
ncbi:MAG: hypothetical protein AAF805_10090 [Planctomycetota bacterium]